MSGKHYLGIDVGGTLTKFVILDEGGRPLERSSISSRGFSNRVFFAKSMRDEYLRLSSAKGLRPRDLGGVGVGVPGPVDTAEGVVISLTNIRGWNHFFLPNSLRRIFRVGVAVDNDANCMALAEARMGAARGLSSVLCVTLGTGVGGGLVLDGGIFRGSFFFGGEVGHIPVVADGRPCPCGGTGCLEAYVGNRALARRVREVFGREMLLEEVSRMAARGDARARRIWHEAGEKIGFAFAGVLNVLNPEAVVVGGGVAGAGRILLDSIGRTMRRYAMSQLKPRVVVRKARLGAEAGVLGAALLAKERFEKKGR